MKKKRKKEYGNWKLSMNINKSKNFCIKGEETNLRLEEEDTEMC